MILKVMKNRKIWLALAVVVIVVTAISGMTLAYEKRESGNITNTFVADNAGVKLNEEFDGSVKKNVSVTNTGSVVSYIRVQLVSYRVNDAGNRIGGTASIPAFTPGNGWLNAGNGLYIYSKPVAASATTAALIGSAGITLQQYTDVDGGKQVVDVIADCVQSNPSDAVKSLWGVDVAADGTLSLKK